MKVGDKVDVMQEISYSSTAPMWNPGWTLEVISGDWALIMKEQDWYPGDSSKTPGVQSSSVMRKKVELIMLRPSTPTPKSGTAKSGRLPKSGAAVMFKVPNSPRGEWAFGLVLQPNRASIKVLYNSKFINRNFNQFIEVNDESR